LTSDVVACGCIIASVKLGEPFTIHILGNSAAHFVGVGPYHGRVMADVGAEPEGFDTFLAKELHFIIPIGNGPFPVGGSALPTLLVDV